MTADKIQARVDDAVKTFDLDEFVMGEVTTPNDTVKVYLDTRLAYEIAALTDEYEAGVVKGDDGPKSITDGAEDAELLARIETLREQFKEKYLELHMRGLNEPERDIIEKQIKREIPINKNMPEEERDELATKRGERVLDEWLRRATRYIVRPDGAVINDVTVGHIETLKTSLYDSEWDKIPAMFAELSYARGLVDSIVDAGFPSGETVSG